MIGLTDGMVGTRYGKWQVIDDKSFYRVCKCECGSMRNIRIDTLMKGRSLSCQKCYRGENIDMTGLKYGRWTVLERLERRSKIAGNVYLSCQCECGRIARIARAHLIHDKSKACRKCCLKKDNGVSAYNTILASYKCNAKSRGFEWSLTDAQFRLLITSDCYYTGLPPSTIRKKETGSVVFNGIDRLDCKRGYTIDNCVPCNPKVNRMKMALGYSEFIETCRLISDHSKKNILPNYKLIAV